MGVYEDVRSALQDIVAPELRVIQTEIKRLDEKIDSGYKRLDEKIDLRQNEVVSEIRRLDEKIGIAINIHERLAILEARVGIR